MKSDNNSSPPSYEAAITNPSYPVQSIPYQQTSGGHAVFVQPYSARNNLAVRRYNEEVFSIQDHLGWSIFNFLCCCWPFGLVGIIMSGQVRERKRLGDVDGARQLSKSTGKWNIFTTFIGFCFIIAIIIYYATR